MAGLAEVPRFVPNPCTRLLALSSPLSVVPFLLERKMLILCRSTIVTRLRVKNFPRMHMVKNST